MTPSMLEVTRKSRPGKVSAELFQRRSSTGTKARGMRACRRATKVFSFPSSDGSTIRAIMILQMGGTAPEEKDVSFMSVTFTPPREPTTFPRKRANVVFARAYLSEK